MLILKGKQAKEQIETREREREIFRGALLAGWGARAGDRDHERHARRGLEERVLRPRGLEAIGDTFGRRRGTRRVERSAVRDLPFATDCGTPLFRLTREPFSDPTDAYFGKPARQGGSRGRSRGRRSCRRARQTRPAAYSQKKSSDASGDTQREEETSGPNSLSQKKEKEMETRKARFGERPSTARWKRKGLETRRGLVWNVAQEVAREVVDPRDAREVAAAQLLRELRHSSALSLARAWRKRGPLWWGVPLKGSLL